MRISDWSSYVCSSDLKKKIKRASHDKSNEKKAERRTGTQTVDELRLAALETQQKNAERTRQLNAERVAAANQKAIMAQIVQIVQTNRQRDRKSTRLNSSH